ncbi:hypothetical protein [Pseudomonas mohnii]
MADLQKALAIINSGNIGRDETEVIDSALASTYAALIPADSVDAVISYIEANLLYNTPNADQYAQLEHLLAELRNTTNSP